VKHAARAGLSGLPGLPRAWKELRRNIPSACRLRAIRASLWAGVRPGGDVLLRLSGWPKVERVLQIVDAVEALGIDPADAAPDYWRHVHNRLSANEVPRIYTQSRHQAWLHRRRIAP
jgi:hypothetical protein